jgi:hypothetical protein
MPVQDLGAGGDDWLPQFLAWLQSQGGAPQGTPAQPNASALGQQPGQPMNPANLPAANAMPISADAPQNLPGSNAWPIPPGGRAGYPPLPPVRPPGLGADPPPQPAYNPLAGGSANTGRPYGVGPPPQPAYNPLAGGSANTGQPPMAAAPAATATAPPARQVPDLGYYRPTSGIAQGPGTWDKLAANDPRRYRGPLSMFGSS